MARLRLAPGAEDATFSKERAATLIADACKERDADACEQTGGAGGLARALERTLAGAAP